MATLELSLPVNNAENARYLTDNFVAVSLSSATNLARIFNVPAEQIQVTTNIQLLHRTEWWAWWSDNKLTTTIGLPEDYKPTYLSPCAEKLIHKICLSASGRPSCGWARLAKIQNIISVERIAVGSSFTPIPETLDRLIVEYTDGQQGVLYALFSAEHTESYFYQVSVELPIEMLKCSTISRLVLSINDLQPLQKINSLAESIAA